MSIVIVGAGPNLGLAIGRRFGREGLPVGLVSRDKAKLDGLVEQLEADGIQASAEAADIRDAGRARRGRSARWRIGSARSRSSSTRRCPRASS